MTWAPDTPSMIEWWTLGTMAKRPCSSPSTTWNSHRGRPRSSGRDARSATRSASSSRPPGLGQAHPADVVVEVEVGVVHHGRVLEPEGHLHHPLPERRHPGQAVGDEAAHGPEVHDRPPHRLGSKTRAPRIWRWVVGDSRERNAPSRPVSRSTVRYRPVDPKPPRPRSLSSSRSTSTNVRRLHPLDDQLGDPVAPLDLVGRLRIGVDQQDGQLVPVAGVDQARGVEAGHPVPEGQAAPGLDESGVAGRDGQGDAGGDHGPAATRRQGHRRPGHQVGPGVPGSGVARQRQIGVEPDHGHGHAGPRPTGTGLAGPSPGGAMALALRRPVDTVLRCRGHRTPPLSPRPDATAPAEPPGDPDRTAR